MKTNHQSRNETVQNVPCLEFHALVLLGRGRGRLRRVPLLVDDLGSEVVVLFPQGLWQRQRVLRVHRRRSRLGEDPAAAESAPQVGGPCTQERHLQQPESIIIYGHTKFQETCQRL